MDKKENTRVMNEFEIDKNNSNDDYKILIKRLISIQEIMASILDKSLKNL